MNYFKKCLEILSEINRVKPTSIDHHIREMKRVCQPSLNLDAWKYTHGDSETYHNLLKYYKIVTGETYREQGSRCPNSKKVRDFHKAFGLNKKPENLPELRLALIDEERDEVKTELFAEEFSKRRLAKELADLLYVVYGAADCYDIDIDKVFSVIHESNMSKLGRDGKPIYREDGKILKGPDYYEADLSFIEE